MARPNYIESNVFISNQVEKIISEIPDMSRWANSAFGYCLEKAANESARNTVRQSQLRTEETVKVVKQMCHNWEDPDEQQAVMFAAWTRRMGSALLHANYSKTPEKYDPDSESCDPYNINAGIIDQCIKDDPNWSRVRQAVRQYPMSNATDDKLVNTLAEAYWLVEAIHYQEPPIDSPLAVNAFVSGDLSHDLVEEFYEGKVAVSAKSKADRYFELLFRLSNFTHPHTIALAKQEGLPISILSELGKELVEVGDRQGYANHVPTADIAARVLEKFYGNGWTG